jgi:DNA repair protein RadC
MQCPVRRPGLTPPACGAISNMFGKGICLSAEIEAWLCVTTPGSRIKDLPLSERPRERLALQGADSLSNADLIAILLRSGRRGLSAVAIAEQLLARSGQLDHVARASVEELRQVKGVGRDKAIAVKAAFTLARRLAREQQPETPLLDTPGRVADLLREDNRCYEVECFQVVLLNTRRRLIRVEKLSQGTLDTLLIHPREVFRSAIAANAAALVIVHNHPSGDPTPSEQDIKVTRDLIRAGQLLKIEILDHVILGRRSVERPLDYVSLRELGYWAGF